MQLLVCVVGYLYYVLRFSLGQAVIGVEIWAIPKAIISHKPETVLQNMFHHNCHSSDITVHFNFMLFSANRWVSMMLEKDARVHLEPGFE